MDVVSPSEWGARVDYDDWGDPYTPDDGVALHHGGGGNYLAHTPPYSRAKEEQQLRAWENYHLSKGWRGLAYGWAVGQTGTLYRIRGWNRYGAHTGDVDGDGIANNSEIVPILFIGSGSRVRLSPAAQESVEWLRRNVIEVRCPDAKRLYGHQEISTTGTTCPGHYGMEYVRTHRLLPEDDMPLTDADIEKVALAVANVKVKRGDKNVPWIQETADIKSLLLSDSNFVDDSELDAAVDRLIGILPDKTLQALKEKL